MSAGELLARLVLSIDIPAFRTQMASSNAWKAFVNRRDIDGSIAIRRILLEGAAVDLPRLSPGARKNLVYLAGASALDAFIEVLGDSSSNPSFDQLAAASDEVLKSHQMYEVVCALGFAVVDNFVAEPHANQLISERFLDSLPIAPEKPMPIRHSHEKVRTSPKSKKVVKKAVPTGTRSAYKRTRNSGRKEVDSPTEISQPAAQAILPVSRRQPPLTMVRRDKRQSVSFTHHLVGKIARIDLPFLDKDDQPIDDPNAYKNRRCLVIGVGPDFVVVRGIFSDDRFDRTFFRSWRRYMDHRSYISQTNQVVQIDTNTVRVSNSEPIPTDEWNDIV